MCRLIVTLALTLTTLGCGAYAGASYGSYGTSPRANLCPKLADVGAAMAWKWQQQGHSLDDALDTIDRRYAGISDPAEVRTATYVRWAIVTVYKHPHWTQTEAYTGVEQACLRLMYS